MQHNWWLLTVCYGVLWCDCTCIKMLWQSSPCRERPLSISVNKTKPCFVIFLPCWLNLPKKTFPCLCFFSLWYLCSRQNRKCQWGNIESDNRLWQCCFSEVWVTVERRRVCRWKIQSCCESGMQNNRTETEWIIQTLWWGQIFSNPLLCRICRY